MSKNYSLDGLREKVDEKYQALEISTDKETFVLRPVLRLDEKTRSAVFSKLEELGEAENDEASSAERVNNVVSVAKQVIELVTEGKRGKALTALLGDDMLLVMEVVNQWQEATQPGEASSSQD